jgi:hypothetical protein
MTSLRFLLLCVSALLALPRGFGSGRATGLQVLVGLAMEFARVWHDQERLVESKAAALRWADFLLCALALRNNE